MIKDDLQLLLSWKAFVARSTVPNLQPLYIKWTLDDVPFANLAVPVLSGVEVVLDVDVDVRWV